MRWWKPMPTNNKIELYILWDKLERRVVRPRSEFCLETLSAVDLYTDAYTLGSPAVQWINVLF